MKTNLTIKNINLGDPIYDAQFEMVRVYIELEILEFPGVMQVGQIMYSANWMKWKLHISTRFRTFSINERENILHQIQNLDLYKKKENLLNKFLEQHSSNSAEVLEPEIVKNTLSEDKKHANISFTLGDESGVATYYRENDGTWVFTGLNIRKPYLGFSEQVIKKLNKQVRLFLIMN